MPNETSGAVRTCLLGCRTEPAPLSERGPGRRYLQCRSCGLAFVFPPPGDREREAQYLRDTSSKAHYYLRASKADARTFSRQIKRLEALRPGKGRLLDVGCSVGTLMTVAREQGWCAEGIEPNGRSADLARRQGFQVHEGCFTPGLAARLPGNYPCVVMNDVLEHFPDPREAVRLAGGLLAEGGLLSILTPNIGSPWTRRFQLKPLEHLFLFGPASLGTLLEQEGFGLLALQRTSRRRSLKQMAFSTTTLGPGLRGALTLLSAFRLDGWVAGAMEAVLRDQLLVVARKGGATP